MRVLIVERSPFLRLVFRELLARANHVTVGECAGLGEAAALAGSLFPDVVLIDLENSDDGWREDLDNLRRSFPAARVIALGPPDPLLGEPGRALCETCLNKPWTPEAVLAAIRRECVADGVLPA